MQLKFKKICLLSTIFVYCVSFLIQNSLGLFQTLAAGPSQPINLVVVLLDKNIEIIKNEKMRWYTDEYIQGKKIPNSKVFVIPLDTDTITAFDIYRMLENIYFDGLKDLPSKLVGVIMFGDIPLPVVNQNGYVFPTVYPYVDFEDQKYVWDSDIKYFVPNGNPGGQAEIWHGLVNLGSDVSAYTNSAGTGFLDKVQRYDSNPGEFVGKSIWYDDFISQKKTFLDDNFKYYRNKIMFAEDLGYQRYSPLMKKMFEGEQIDSTMDIVSNLSGLVGFDDDLKQQVSQLKTELSDSNYTTKMIQQEIETSFTSDYGDLFSQADSSIIRENIFAGSRWIKEYTDENGEKSLIMDLDGSTSKIQLKDNLLLGNENLQGLIENLNDLMENMINKKIEDKNLSMDIVIPVSYKKITKKRVSFKCRSFVERFENFYFGNNARFIDKAEDLSIYRGTYRNLSTISGVTYDSLLTGKNQVKSDYDSTNVKLKSIGGSYDIFSMQAEGNRGFNMFNVDGDLDIYDENKTQKNRETKHKGLFGKIKKRLWPDSCNDNDKKHTCEDFLDFTKRWWGGASPINLNADSVGNGRYELNGYVASDSWRSIYSMAGFQSLLTGEDEGSNGVGWKNGKSGGPQWDATSYKSYIKYSSPTQREGWRRFRWMLLGKGYELYENHTPDVHLDFDEINYRDLGQDIVKNWTFTRMPNGMFSLIKKLSGCGGGGSEEYVYKVISSVVKHTSTTDDQINGIDHYKYGDNGSLGKYYSDLRIEYENLRDTMLDSVNSFSGLIVEVNSGNDYLSGKFLDLKNILLNGSINNSENTGLEEKLLELESEMSGLQAQLSGLEISLNVLNGGVGRKVGVITGDNKNDGILSPIKGKTDNNNVATAEKLKLEGEIAKVKQEIDSLSQQIESIKSQMNGEGYSFLSGLNEISEFIKYEKTQLAKSYELATSLYTDDIVGVFEFIAYLEGGHPDEILEGSSNLEKIGFLQSWIDNINSMVQEVRGGEPKLLSGYEEVYSLVLKQQEDWFELANELKEINEDYSAEIDNVTLEMEQIFVIEEEDEDEEGDDEDIPSENGADESGAEDDGTETEVNFGVILSGSTAIEEMSGFESKLSELEVIFSNLIVRDQTGDRLIIAAKRDNDFKNWLKSEKIDFSVFSDVDWINTYADWAKGPGRDSIGAKNNHNLLLGASEHEDGINLLTPDRPIDSPRYVSMQSVAGREMKFIYPDLFKVEVYQLAGKTSSGYDINLLLTGGEIKKNLIKYLQGKVEEYNKIFKNECDNALSMNSHFDRLRKESYLHAIPDKTFHSCGNAPFKYEDFVEALGGEKMLDTISEVLYYQSLTNTRKLSAGNIDEDIEFIRQSFGINEKRKQILEDYLVEGNEKTKNLVFEIPTYQKSGYEIGYINSDGKDYIFPSVEIEEKTYKFDSVTNNTSKNQSDFSDDGDDDKYCNVPVGGTLPLFDETGSPWLRGIVCWFKEVKEKPFSVKLTFDGSLGEVLSAKSFGDAIKKSLNLDESFSSRKNSWSDYADEWEDLLKKDKTNDYDARITQMQVDADISNQEMSNGGDGISNLMARIDKNLRIDSSSFVLSDINPTINLKIGSLSDLGKLTITFEGTGDSCLKIGSNSLCNGKSYTINGINPKENPFSGVISSDNHVAGKVALIVKIGAGSKYITKIIKYTISPGEPKTIGLNVMNNEYEYVLNSDGTETLKTIKNVNNESIFAVGGMMIPISTALYDENHNIASWGTEKYTFTATTGRFLKNGGYMNSFETNDFRDLNFYYEVPEDYVGETYIQVLKIDNYGKDTHEKNQDSKKTVLATLPINVLKATLETKIDETLIDDNVCHTLGYADSNCNPCTNPACSCSHSSCGAKCTNNGKVILAKDGYEEIYNSGKLDISKLHKINISLKDGEGKVINIDNQLLVTSQNGLLVFGQVNKQDNGDYSFMKTSKFYMSGGKAVIYYYLSTVAGSDKIKFNVSGIKSRIIDFEITPKTCDIQKNYKLKNGYIKLGVPDYVETFSSDVFGNRVDGKEERCYDQLKLDFPKNKGAADKLCGWNSEAGDWNYKQTVTLNNGYDRQEVVGLKAGPATYADLQFEVTTNLLPNTGLNVMYLNYFGNDWGNQWGYRSENNKYIESLMKNSGKIIATTTQLVSEDKIKKLLWTMDPFFRISNFDNLNTTMTFNNVKNKLTILVRPSELSDDVSVSLGINSVKNVNSLQEIEDWLSDSKNNGDNYLFYIPSEGGYTISNNFDLKNNDEIIGSLYENSLSLKITRQTLDNGDNIWNLIYNGELYGNVVLHLSKKATLSIDEYGNAFASRYSMGHVFVNGTTNDMSSVGVFDEFSNFELNSSYDSIQDSKDSDKRIGFIGDFKNITLFAGGESVGEATKKFGSELLINLGDPLLSLEDEQRNENAYGMNYDGGVGREIYEDGDGGIFGTYVIDFDNNKINDLLVVYLDGRFKLAKNYASDPNQYDMRNLQELMRLAVPIKEIFVGDADGNKYDDIIVYTQNNQMRAYLNHDGAFDVDGNVICLNQNVYGGEKSSTPSDLEGIDQFFVEDMDLDGSADIITYDAKGYIKVFYGGGNNYLSKDKYSCDNGWYDRQKGNITEIGAFGVELIGGGGGMLYWPGISRPNAGDEDLMEITNPSEYGINLNIDTEHLEKLIKSKERNSDGSIEDLTKEIMSTDNFDLAKASEKFVEEQSKYVDVTLYENTLVGSDSNNYLFTLGGDKDSKCNFTKNFKTNKGTGLLADGDLVTVTVSVECRDVTGAFGDIIKGPRNIYYNNKGIIKSFKFIGNKGSAVVKGRDGNFAYIVDDIRGHVTFQYELEYRHVPLKIMSITHKTYWSEDEYPDIKLKSVDGCVKDFSGYVNQGKSRKFVGVNVPLQEKINNEYLKEESNTQDFTEDMFNNGSDLSKLGIIGDKIYRIKLLQSMQELEGNDEGKNKLKEFLLNGSDMSFAIDVSIFEKEMEKIDNIVDDLMKGMCNGFSFGGSNNCKGLPVPFNQAFLAPGKYHLFGCWQLPMGPLENGLPIFFFPGTLPIGPINIPIPRGLRSPADGFLRPGGGVYPSFIRIYAAPTLTAQLGIAVCISPDRIRRKVPSPISDIAGNCVVFAVKPQCKRGDDEGIGKDKNNPNEVYAPFTEDVKDSGICTSSKHSMQNGYTSFKVFDYDAKVDVNGGQHNAVDFSTNYLGVINFDMESRIGFDDGNSRNSIFIGDIDVLGGDFNVNQIKGGIRQGVRGFLIDNWLDPQIRYIANQLTKMHINVKLPDVSSYVGEAQKIKDMTNDYTRVDTGWASKLGAWSYINYDNLNNLSNEPLANPFESFAAIMNKSDIINVSIEPITVKVPWIFAEDINSYQMYLNQWLEVNNDIINQWSGILNSLVVKCGNIDDDKEKQECYNNAKRNLDSFIEFTQEGGDWEKMQDQIYVNLKVLQEYRNFPFEVYEWIHAIDRYMSEIISLVGNTIGYLSYWTTANSERFVGYVDAIILMINIIKTYQIIIDFPVEWSKNCGTCAKDTYDQYSCKLSILCKGLQLPIIQIPNFKLPNITLDLSDIDFSLDLILPSFNFQPLKIPLPDLPNLPEPPTIGANIKWFDLPDIPILPEPPELPELPSFIPEIDMELPILPPAPELPKIPSTLEGFIDISKMIGKIYCIVKGKFGLVGESSVKAKIEQLTQRTYEVSWIDNISNFTNWTAAPVKNYGLDYEISSHVDFQFEFSSFYTYLDTLTKSINNFTTSSVKWASTSLNDAVNYEKITNFTEGVDGANLTIEGEIGMVDNNFDVEGVLSEDIEYTDYDSAKSSLQKILAKIKSSVENTNFEDSMSSSVDKIENQINIKNVVEPNIEGFEKVENDLVEYLNGERSKYRELADLINNDYDGFLAMIDSQTGFKYDSGELLTFNVQLFNVNSSTRDNINLIKKSNPYIDLLDNKKEIVDGYWNAINTNTANDLGISNSQYLAMREGIGMMKNQITSLYSLTKPISSTNLIAKNGSVNSDKTLLSATDSKLRLGSNMSVAEVIDPSTLSNGIYGEVVSGVDVGKLGKAVYSDYFASKIGSDYYKLKNNDMILHDDKSVYMKCVNQNCFVGGGKGGTYYYENVLSYIPYQETYIRFDSDTMLKIADANLEVKNWKVIGQTFDNLSFSWKLENVDGYLIDLTQRIDYNYEKNFSKKPIYVLALPRGSYSLDDLYRNGTKLELIGDDNGKEIRNLYGTGKDLVQVVYYDSTDELANIIISNIDRKWYYMRISTLDLIDNTYKISSPWSNQIVAGKQALGDEVGPNGEAVLYRPSTKENVSKGNTLEGYVGTKYNLVVNWTDNVALKYINLSKDGKLLDEKYTVASGDSITASIDIHTKGGEKEIYNSVGIDQFGNRVEKVITVSYSVPEISITNVSMNNDGKTALIQAELSQDVDQGNVSFQRKRGTLWKTLRKGDLVDPDILLNIGQKSVEGNYSVGGEIALYDKNDKVMALMNPDTAEIKFQSGYDDKYGVRVVVEDSLVLQVYDKKTESSVFSIYVPVEECSDIDVGNSFNKSDLSPVGTMGMFNGGMLISSKISADNVLFVSPTCHLYSELGMYGTYSYDLNRESLAVVLYQPSDSEHISPLRLWLKAKPLKVN